MSKYDTRQDMLETLGGLKERIAHMEQGIVNYDYQCHLSTCNIMIMGLEELKDKLFEANKTE